MHGLNIAPAVSVGFHDAHTIAMEINAAADSWVRNVAMIDTTEGIRTDFNSERISLTRVDVEQSKTVTSSAKPFDFDINGTQVLVDRATGTGDSVFYFATGPRQQGPVVILNSVFHGGGNLEPHRNWSTGLLVDNCSVPDGGIHLVKIFGEDETLHQGDVRTVCGVQRKALRENSEQTVVHGLRVLEHPGVRL